MARILLKEKIPEYKNEIFYLNNEIVWNGRDNFIFLDHTNNRIKFVFVVNKKGIRKEFDKNDIIDYGLGIVGINLSYTNISKIISSFSFVRKGNLDIFSENYKQYFFGISYDLMINSTLISEHRPEWIELFVPICEKLRTKIDRTLKTKSIIR